MKSLRRMEILMYDEDDEVVGMMEIVHPEGHVEIHQQPDLSIDMDTYRQALFAPPPSRITITGNLVKYIDAQTGER